MSIDEKKLYKIKRLEAIIESGNAGILQYLFDIEEKMDEMKRELSPEIKDLISQVKGKDGYTPEKGVDYFDGEDGEDGKDYVLSSYDKKEIAASISVPVVEKVIEKIEVVKQPIVRNEIIKEVVKEIRQDYDASPLEERIDLMQEELLSKIEILRRETASAKVATGGRAGPQIYSDGVKVGTRTNEINFVGPTVEDEYGRITITTTGGGGGGGLSRETPVGTVNDSNTTFTVSNDPYFIVINGAMYGEGEGLFQGYSTGTITLSAPVGTGGFITSYYQDSAPAPF